METTHSLRKPAILLAVSAMFAAMVTVTTAYLFHIPIGSNGGYIHVGDAFIYLAAAFCLFRMRRRPARSVRRWRMC